MFELRVVRKPRFHCNRKLVILKKIIKELKYIRDEIEGYKRGNEYDREKFLSKMNYIDHLITITSDG